MPEIPRYGRHYEVVGLPDKALILTNSERMTSACPLRWLFAHGYRMRPKVTARPLAMGTAVHACIEDVQLWWMHHDSTYPGDGMLCIWCRPEYRPSQPAFLQASECEHCKGTGHGPIAQHAEEWRMHALADASGFYSHEQADADVQTLTRAFEGWLHVYGREPDRDFRVVAPELRMAAPVLTAAGRTYRAPAWVIPDPKDPDGWRHALVGEAKRDDAKLVRWPMYQVLTIDAVWQHRQTGDLYVYEAKTARDPSRKFQNLSVDPQVPGYAAALQHCVNKGLVAGIDKSARVAGYVYDVMSNRMQKDPEPLAPIKVKALHPDTGEPYKIRGRWVYEVDAQGQPIERSPGMKRTGSTIPSWRYRAALQTQGLPVAEYEDHLLNLMATVDSKLYVREINAIGPEVMGRYRRELHAWAKQLASWRRTAATMEAREEADVRFPRQPVCLSSGYGCAYRAPCLQDGDLVRRDYDMPDRMRSAPKHLDNTTQEGSFPW